MYQKVYIHVHVYINIYILFLHTNYKDVELLRKCKNINFEISSRLYIYKQEIRLIYNQKNY